MWGNYVTESALVLLQSARLAAENKSESSIVIYQKPLGF